MTTHIFRLLRAGGDQLEGDPVYARRRDADHARLHELSGMTLNHARQLLGEKKEKFVVAKMVGGTLLIDFERTEKLGKTVA